MIRASVAAGAERAAGVGLGVAADLQRSGPSTAFSQDVAEEIIGWLDDTSNHLLIVLSAEIDHVTVAAARYGGTR